MTISTVAVCCDDLGLMADARRLCAAAGLDVEIAGALDAHRWWRSAAAVLLDVAAAAQLTAQGLPRRARVALLTRDDDPWIWRFAVLLGAEQVASIPADEAAVLAGVLTLGSSAGGARAVACVPATGGAGSSTVAVGLALAAARQGTETLLVDGDPTAGGLDLLLGVENAPGLRWPDVAAADPDTPADVILDALVRPAPRLRLLSCGRQQPSHDAPRADWPSAILGSARVAGAGVGLVVLDLPRPAVDTELPAVDIAVLVVRAGVRQAVAAAALASRLRAAADDVRLVVLGASRSGLSATEMVDAVGVPLAVELPHDRRVALAADDGRLAGVLSRMPFDDLAATVTGASGRAA